ncbi:MAG: glycogen synthase [Opitutales bacterium]
MASQAEAEEQLQIRKTLRTSASEDEAAATRAPFTPTEETLRRETEATKEEPTPLPALEDSEGHRPDLAPDGRPWHEIFMRPGIPKMHIVHIASELSPVAKVGGLADVVFGLSRELEIRGNEVEIILPKYDCLRYDHVWGLQPVYHDLWVPWAGGRIHCTVFFGFVHGRKVFLIEPHDDAGFFFRSVFYGHKDDVHRFAFFSRAAMEFLLKSGKRPNIIHCHDWQTALVPVFLWEIYSRLGMDGCRACYTIHNFRHQGICGHEMARLAELPDHVSSHERLLDNHNPTALNLMKGGVVYSNFVTTVSPRHAAEARDMGQGFGLEGTLQIHGAKYGGVLNGIDYDTWNPETDPHIPHHFNIETLDGKYANKRALRQRLWIGDNEKPIIAFIGRLDPQKGLDLVRHALFYAINHGAQFVLLGSSPESGINDYFWQLKHYLNDNEDSHIEVGFNSDLAHLIYAGADMMIVPSRFEPCGLTQLISMRYGTIPLVRSVGGLADTVFDKDHSQRPLHERNGYVFHQDDYPAVESALSRAIACYYQYPDDFRALIENAMKSDFSWNVPAQHYLNIYDHIRAQ